MTFLQKQIKLMKRPIGTPTKEDFETTMIPIEEPKEGEVLLRTIYLSVDPYLRGRMSDAKSYAPSFELNEPIVSGIIGQVVESKSEHFKKGDITFARLPWQQYIVASGDTLQKVDPKIAPPSAYLSVVGMTGLTAYFGMTDIGQPKKGETVVVSGAAGAVGSTAGQIAKIKGATVVGIAGSAEKIDYLIDELGFDAAINYKTENMKEALEKHCPNGIDVYYENVGGEITDAVYPLLNQFSRMPVCGSISSYNNTSPDEDVGIRVQRHLIRTSGLMKGFIVGDYAEHFPEGRKALAKWYQEGKLKYKETVTEGFDNAIDAFLDLFKGANIGKSIVKVSEFE